MHVNICPGLVFRDLRVMEVLEKLLQPLDAHIHDDWLCEKAWKDR